MSMSTYARTCLAGAVAAAALASLALASPATASASSSRAAHRALAFAPVHLGSRTHGFVHGKNEDGGNWSGYAIDGSGFQSIVAKWKEPKVTCNSSNDLFAPWVGIDGFGTNTVEQTGVATDCSGGSPEYAGWYEMYPAAPVYYSEPVSAGDTFTAKVTRSNHTYTLKLSDATKGWTKTTVKTLSSAHNASAEVIMESPTAAYPNFGKVSFTGAKINGSSLASFSPIALDASNHNGFEDHTSAISNGTDFHITYERE